MSRLKSFKLKVNPRQSQYVQTEMINMGYRWANGQNDGKEVIHTDEKILLFQDNGKIFYSSNEDISHETLAQFQEITFEEFKMYIL